MNAPDREIYLRATQVDTLIDWLQTQLGSLRLEHKEAKQTNLLAHHNGGDVPIFILEDTPAKPYCCLWIQSDKVPWPDDLTLAQAISAALGCETRCTANAWHEGEDEENDEWIVISQGEQKKIIWRG